MIHAFIICFMTEHSYQNNAIYGYMILKSIEDQKFTSSRLGRMKRRRKYLATRLVDKTLFNMSVFFRLMMSY
jgi:hypothetical protein